MNAHEAAAFIEKKIRAEEEILFLATHDSEISVGEAEGWYWVRRDRARLRTLRRLVEYCLHEAELRADDLLTIAAQLWTWRDEDAGT